MICRHSILLSSHIAVTCLLFLGCDTCINESTTIATVPDTSPELPQIINTQISEQCLGEFIRIPPGMFRMGRDAYMLENHSLNSNSDAMSSPSSVVIITKGFYVGKTNITCGQYAKFLIGIHKDKQERYVNMRSDNKVRQYKNDNEFAILCDESEPIKTVSWPGAVAFCEWLSETSGQTFMLPTEAQWEYAARGHGNAYDSAWEYGNINYPKPSPTPPNGIQDMATGYLGNWCQDHFGSFTTTAKTDPAGPAFTPKEYLGLDTEMRVLRRPLFTITGRSGGFYPENQTAIYGFRLVLDEDSVKSYLKSSERFDTNVKLSVIVP